MRARTTGTYIAIALATIVAAVLAVSRSACVEFAYPAERAHRYFVNGVCSRVVGFFRGAAASAENVRLKRDVAALALLRGDIERLESENARLRRALGYQAKNPEFWLAAEVLSENGGAMGAKNSIRVDRGSLSGVKKGAVVVVPEGLVGRVTSVSPHTSEVTLITDGSIKVACMVESQDSAGLHGILSGGGEDLLILRHLKGAGIAIPRSRVLTSGLGGVFPKGIEVGTLLGITNRVRSVEGEVQPQVDYSTLEDVFIRREK